MKESRFLLGPGPGLKLSGDGVAACFIGLSAGVGLAACGVASQG